MKQKKVCKNILMILAMLVFLFSWCSVVHAEENVLLKDMPIEEWEGEHVDIGGEEIEDSNGNHNSRNILEMCTISDTHVVYKLDGQYTRFSGKIVMDKTESIVINDTSLFFYINIGIYGDGRELYSKALLTKETEAQNFDIDVTGVGKLEIRSSGVGIFSLEEGIFTKAEQRIEPQTHVSLGDLKVIDSVNFAQRTSVQMDAFGGVHRGKQYFNNSMDTDTESYALYNLDLKYSSFSGKLITDYIDNITSDNDCNMNVQIYLDDQLAFEQNGIGWNTEPVEVNLNVTNTKIMKIRVVGKEGYLCVVDDSLKAHTPGDWEIVTEATCEKAGKSVRRCTECKAICNTSKIKALGHTPGDWKVEEEATCKAEGKRKKYCTVCKKMCAEEMIPKLEHKEEDEWFEQEAPTCTSEGTRIKRCIYCGETVKTEKIPQTKHEFGKWTTAEGSVWNAPIVKKRTCNVCDAEEVKNIYTWVWVKPAVLVLLFVSVLTGTTIILIRRKGIQTISKNQRKFWRKKKREKRTQQEDVFHGHQ